MQRAGRNGTPLSILTAGDVGTEDMSIRNSLNAFRLGILGRAKLSDIFIPGPCIGRFDGRQLGAPENVVKVTK